ncbi:MAG TPA: ribosome maturation factor RimP [Gammaproteobacteria bacterium]|nr:ribosome maturation factor RimP [Gammaproteobacteria bacterium]
MDTVRDKLFALLEPTIERLGYSVVDIEYHPRGRRSTLRIFIDSASGITLDDCSRVSHQVSGVLDVEDPVPGAYELEVSSPGLDRPLRTAADFERFAGSEVTLKMHAPVNGRRRFRGKLVGLEDGQIVLDVADERFRFARASVDKVKLVPEL